MAACRELSQAQKIPELSLSLGLKGFVAQLGLAELKPGVWQSKAPSYPRGCAGHPGMPIPGSSTSAVCAELFLWLPMGNLGQGSRAGQSEALHIPHSFSNQGKLLMRENISIFHHFEPKKVVSAHCDGACASLEGALPLSVGSGGSRALSHVSKGLLVLFTFRTVIFITCSPAVVQMGDSAAGK